MILATTAAAIVALLSPGPAGAARTPDREPITQSASGPDSTVAAPTVPPLEPIQRLVPQDSVPAPQKKPSRFDQPKWVMLRSLVLPGWGQAHNGSWVKAGGVAAGEVWLGLRLLDDRRDLDRLQGEIAEAQAAHDAEAERAAIDAYNSRLTSYTARQWFLGGLVAYALLDAYIGAHFKGFDVEFEGDPALPDGKAPPAVKMSLRRSF